MTAAPDLFDPPPRAAPRVLMHRWVAEIDYQHDDGVRTVTRGLHELTELHDIVEAGPNFYAIVAIRIGPPRHSAPLTVEEAEQP